MIGLLVLLLLVTLWLTRSKRGNKVAEKIMMRLLKTRFGPRLRRWQVRTYAKQQGVSLTDATGRERTEMELMLEVSPEAEHIRKQLRTMNPQQRAQAMRMLAAQQELVDTRRARPEQPARLGRSAARASPGCRVVRRRAPARAAAARRASASAGSASRPAAGCARSASGSSTRRRRRTARC